MAHVVVKDGRVALAANVDAKPYLPDAETIMYALRDPQGRLLVGDAQLPVVPVSALNAQTVAMAQVGGRSVRSADHAIRYPRGGCNDHRGRYPAGE